MPQLGRSRLIFLRLVARVLMPVRSITSMELPTFRLAFALLQRHFVVSRNARLVKATLLIEDTNTLAYVCK